MIDINEHAKAFVLFLRRLKQQLPDAPQWYPYDTLASLPHILSLLGEDFKHLLLPRTKDSIVLDVGCGDGDLSFFLENLGWLVHAIDHPLTNHNHMQGVMRLRSTLRSAVDVCAVDLDAAFQLPSERYDLIIFCGTLYHLQNPFHVLKELAKSTKYCILSTRIAARLPSGACIDDESVAYLVDEYELNADNSNYWIFSGRGLERILGRTKWEVIKSLRVGYVNGSEPVSAERDERIYCLLRSCYSDRYNVKFLHGWYEPEGEGWRWVQPAFGVRVEFTPADRAGVRLVLEIFVPQALIDAQPHVELRVEIDGQWRSAGVYDQAGMSTCSIDIPRWSIQDREAVDVLFTVDASLLPTAEDARPLGIIVNRLWSTSLLDEG